MEKKRKSTAPGRSARGGKYARPKTKKAPRPLTLRDLRLLLPAVALVIAVVIVLYVVNLGSTYTFSDSGVQYYGETAVPIPRGTKMKRQEDGTTLLIRSGKGSVSGLPVYLDSSREIVLPQDAIYYEPRMNLRQRVLHFSHVACTSSGSVTVIHDAKRTTRMQGFLHDGHDLYLFLEPVTLTCNGYVRTLPALSYVEAAYGGQIVIFDYDTRECTIEQTSQAVTASSIAGDYEISLLGDSFTTRDGKHSLLFSRTDLVDPIS